ncbi:O-antigen ligase [Ulvibacter sp. MAR_2010_11]|uniref:O-antigen ligase family protein n=1 Tax=Ulvibacter sp. MAR_2010_11 TaxID=1250229 RepID=UPI000C2B7C07|nr:O-antigen ligase family protein [Ulvibacter sp. MAR_2010_11]PKA82910.1 O-antigen ligase [Ulvibacter sp. MAR_2010_11]
MKIILASVYPYAFMLLYLIIPFDDYMRVLPNILLGILAVTFPFIVTKQDFKKLSRIPFLLFAFLFVYLLINTLFTDRWDEDFKIIKKVFVVISLVLLYIPIQDFQKIHKAIIFSSLAAILFSLTNLIILSITSGNFELGNSPMVIEALLVDRLYLGLLAVASILVSGQSIPRKYHPHNNYNLANIIVNILFILIIGSKLAIALLILLAIVRQFYGKRRVVKVIAAMSLSILVALFVFSLEKKHEGSNIQNFSALHKFVNSTMTWELRSEAWHCSHQIIEAEGLITTGFGFENTKEKLIDCYNESIKDAVKREEFISERYNTHNQFFDLYIGYGIVSVLLFLGFLLLVFWKSRKDYYSVAFLLSLIFYCLVENLFHRQIGVYYMGLFLILLLIKNTEIQNNNPKTELK